MKLGTAINSIGDATNITSVSNAIKGLSTDQAVLAMSTAKVSPAMMTEALMANKVEKEVAEAAIAHAGMSTAQKVATKTTSKLTAATAGLKAVITPTSLIIAGVVAAVAALAIAWDATHTSAKEAREAIKKSNEEYEEGISTLKDINSELESVNENITKILSQDKISLSDQEELNRLKEQRSELERMADAQERYNQAKAAETVATISDGFRALQKDFTQELDDYNLAKNKLDDFIPDGISFGYKAVDVGSSDYHKRITELEGDVAKAYSVLYEQIEEYESYKQNILDKYSGDVTKFNAHDKQLFQSISQSLQDAYRSIYNEQEYYNFVVKPVIDVSDLKDDDLIKYFEDGGKLNTSALEKVFGEDIIDALELACQEAGMALPTLLQHVYKQADFNSPEKQFLRSRLGAGDLMQYIGQFKNMNADELRNMDFTDKVTAQEAAFHNLLGVLGYTQENAEVVISVLEELGLILSTPIDTENGLASSLTINEDQAKALSEYQSKIDSIGESLLDIASLSSSDITSLMVDFKDNAQAMKIFEDFGITGEQGVGDLEGALRALAELMRKLTVDECPQLKDAINAIFEETITNPGVKIFEKVQDVYDAKLADFERQANLIEAYLAQAESKGQLAVKGYYQELYANEELKLDELRNKRDDLEKALAATGLTSGQEFDNLQDEIDDVTIAIAESENALLEFKNTMRDVDWAILDFNHEQAQRTMNESDFLLDLLDGKDLVDKMGELTNEGMASIGLHNVNYNGYLEESEKYAEDLVALEQQIADAPDDTNLLNRYNEVLEKRQEMILAAESEKEAVADLVREGYEAQKNALQELIDEYTEALDAEKD